MPEKKNGADGTRDLFAKCAADTRQADFEAQGLYPYFQRLTSGQDNVVTINGHRTLMLGSNNYLGLTSDPRTKAAAMEALRRYGTGCSGSRFLNGNLDIHEDFEREQAAFVGKEACLTFSTGFQANLAIISSICGREDSILADSLNHASLVDACRLSFAVTHKYRHNDMTDLERLLMRTRERCRGGILIVSDGVFSMEGEICNLPKLVRLARKYGARLMLDDAHALGVLGSGGRGTAERFDLLGEVDLIMNTFSKSYASLGGCVLGSETAVRFIKHHARPFIFSASMPPSSVAAAREAMHILREEPWRVQRLHIITAQMKAYWSASPWVRLRESGNGEVPILPVLTGSVRNTLLAAQRLMEAGVYVNPVLPPAVPADSCLLRTSCTATMTDAFLEEAAETLERVLKELRQSAEWEEESVQEEAAPVQC